MKTTFQIGNCVFTVNTDFTVIWDKNAAEFIIDQPETESGTSYHIHAADELPPAEGKIVLQRDDMEIRQTPGGEERRYKTGNHTVYAVSVHDEILYDRRYRKYLKDNKVLFSLLSLERLMLGCGSLILHSSYIIYRGTAILFTAPSGTGKSTQADLWQKYRCAKIINGDRSLIRRNPENGLWMADGWPFSGSSPFCLNQSAPIRAIVYLSQQPYNRAERLNPAQAVGKLLSETTVNFWNGEYVGHIMNELEELAFQIPYYHLGCTAGEDAVECLEKALEERI